VASAEASHALAGLPSIVARVSDSKLPPNSACSSHRITRSPRPAASSAAAIPAGPAPTTSVSQCAWRCV